MQYSLLRGRNGGGIALGAALLALGLGLTWWGFQSEAPGGARIIFVGLLLGGLVRLLTALFIPSVAQTVVYCWQCGAHVRQGSVICLACGATQPTQPAAQPRTSRYTTGASVIHSESASPNWPPPIPPQPAFPYRRFAPAPSQQSQPLYTPPPPVYSPPVYSPPVYSPPASMPAPYTAPHPAQVPLTSSQPLYTPVGWDERVGTLEEDAVPLPPPELPPADAEFERPGLLDDANGHPISFE